MDVSIRVQNEISDQLSSIVGMMTPIQSLQEPSSSTNLTLDPAYGGVTVSPPTINSNFNQAQKGNVAIGSLPLGSSRLREDGQTHQSELVQDLFHNLATQKCETLCSCVCHTRSVIKSPWILETIIGRINIQYVGRRPACNEFHCRRLPECSFRVVYQFPKYVLSRYISMVMHNTPLSGPELLLRMPRMVSWSHMLWKYANNGELMAIQKLFAEGKASPYDVNPMGSSALWYTVNRRHCQLAQFLLDQGVDSDHLNEIGKTPSDLLWEHSFAGGLCTEGIGIIGSILKESHHAQTQSLSTLHKIILGIVCRDLESELELSTAEINMGDAKNRTPLCWATIRNDSQAVNTLLVFGANPNIVDSWGHTPLDFARSVGICKMLLDAGVDLHAPKSEYGRSSLHELFHITGGYFLESESVDVIDLLVNAGIAVDVRDSDEETPLLNAIYSGYTSHVRRLLDLGADPNLFNRSSHESAIHFAVSFDRIDMIPLLLKRGADYTAVNISGSNIAHMAARFAGTKTISVLADSNLVKLDMHLRNKDGKTPTDYLSERSVLIDSEQGLHAEFERFMKSIPVPGEDTSGGSSKAAIGHDSSQECDGLRLPGSYPVLTNADFSY